MTELADNNATPTDVCPTAAMLSTAVALILQMPEATAVTKPDPLTVATPASVVDHVIPGLIGRSSWSYAYANNWIVEPTVGM